MKDAGCRLSFWEEIWFMGIGSWQPRQTGEFFLIGAARQRRPTRWKVGRAVCFALARGDDGNDFLFITHEFINL